MKPGLNINTCSTSSFSDCYSFGSPMPGRNFNSNSYRYGFNGKEKDDETYGDGDEHDFGARIYDPRLGRWMSVDRSFKRYAGLSSYSFSFDNPIFFNDPDGKDAIGKVDGTTITISSVIYIIGDGATKGKAQQMQKEINGIYGKGGTYKDANGTVYNVKFDIQVKAIVDPLQVPFDGKSNLVTLVDKSKLPDGRSFVEGSGGKYGTWANTTEAGTKTYAHETGHLIGLDDQYVDMIKDESATPDQMYIKADRKNYTDYYDGVDPTQDIMANSQFKGAKITQNEINSLAEFVLSTKNSSGEARINAQTVSKKGDNQGVGLGVTPAQNQIMRNKAESYGYNMKSDVKK